ncbi:serpin B9, partial [Sigmodon hispidus]
VNSSPKVSDIGIEFSHSLYACGEDENRVAVGGAEGLKGLKVLKTGAECEQCRHTHQLKVNGLKELTEGAQGSSCLFMQTILSTQDLLSNDSVSPQTRMVLVNSLYFKGTWNEVFSEDLTREMPFKTNEKKTRPVQMMYQKDTFNLAYVDEVQAQVLEMPYKGMRLSLLVLLPDDGVKLSKVENNLTFEKLTSWTKPGFMKSTTAQVYLPKFTLQENYDMKSVLQLLGMTNVFQEDKADLSGMSPERDLYLSSFVHKSVVEISEKGTEAAAASADEWAYLCGSLEKPVIPVFCADHPFLFFIRHNQTNTLLFCGRFSSP